MKNSKKTYLLFVCILLAINGSLNAQISSLVLESKVDSLLVETNGKQVPGSVILIVKDGEILFNKGYGLANLEHEIRNNPTTVFDIASVSKQFLGFAIAMLIENGEISEQDDIRKYIPELPDFGHTITINHLIHHTSGIRDWTGTLTMAGWNFDDIINFDQILRMAFNQKELNFVPGSEFSYSNTGYNLLAEVVQRVTKISFREWTTKNIFEPLKMNNSFFLDDLTEVISKKANSYYKGEDEKFHLSYNNTIALGSSSLNTTTNDLAKWVINLDNKKVGGKSVINRIFQTGVLNNGKSIEYAYGFWVGQYRGTKWVDHTGGWESFRTYLTHFPNKNLSIVVLNNNNQGAFGTAMEIAKLFIPNTKKSTKSKKSRIYISIREDLINDYVGIYKLGPAWYLHISKKGNYLFAKETGEKENPIYALSESSFWIIGNEKVIDFERSTKTGTITAINYNGKKRQKVATVSEVAMSNLAEYEGEYKSDELQTSYIVRQDKGKIYLHHFRRGQIKLVHAWKDDFEAEEWLTNSIEFIRDNKGTVIGFKATEGGARNQKFDKVTN